MTILIAAASAITGAILGFLAATLIAAGRRADELRRDADGSYGGTE